MKTPLYRFLLNLKKYANDYPFLQRDKNVKMSERWDFSQTHKGIKKFVFKELKN